MLSDITQFKEKLSSVKSNCTELMNGSYSSECMLTSVKSTATNAAKDAGNSLLSKLPGSSIIGSGLTGSLSTTVSKVQGNLTSITGGISGTLPSMSSLTSRFCNIGSAKDNIMAQIPTSFPTAKIKDKITGVITEKLTSVGLANQKKALSMLGTAKSMFTDAKSKLSDVVTSVTSVTALSLTSVKDMASGVLSSIPKMPSMPSIPTLPGFPAMPKLPSIPGIPTLPDVGGLLSGGFDGMPKIPGFLTDLKMPTMPEIPSLDSLKGDISGLGTEALSNLTGLFSEVGLPAMPTLPTLPGILSSIELPSIPLPDSLSDFTLPEMPSFPTLPTFEIPAILPDITELENIVATQFDEVKEIVYDYV